jgi:hypothetical protein
MPIISSAASASARGYGFTAGSFRFVISSDTTNVDARAAALSAGWDGTSRLIVVINSGVYVYGTSLLLNQGCAFYVPQFASGAMDLAFPSGIELINNGTIVGVGGAGGAGGAGSPTAGSAGTYGGDGLGLAWYITVTNNGTIAGGGGGGGGGGGANYGDWYGGGGGGGGAPYGAGGAHGAWSGAGTGGTTDGSSATFTTGGAGGPTINVSAAGGAGGNWGTAGNAGSSSAQRSGGAGGVSGRSVSGYSFVTWNATGTLLGPTV